MTRRGEPALDCSLTVDGPVTPETVTAAVDRLYGYHQVKFPSPLELLCWAVLRQRVPLPVARPMKQSLVEAAGNRVDLDGVVRWAFPDAEQLAVFDERELRRLIGNEHKAAYLHGSMRRWLDLDERFLRTGPYEEVREELLSFPGIGPWSASFLLIRGLGSVTICASGGA